MITVTLPWPDKALSPNSHCKEPGCLVTCGGYLLVLAIALLAILFGVGIE